MTDNPHNRDELGQGMCDSFPIMDWSRAVALHDDDDDDDTADLFTTRAIALHDDDDTTDLLTTRAIAMHYDDDTTRAMALHDDDDTTRAVAMHDDDDTTRAVAMHDDDDDDDSAGLLITADFAGDEPVSGDGSLPNPHCTANLADYSRDSMVVFHPEFVAGVFESSSHTNTLEIESLSESDSNTHSLYTPPSSHSSPTTSSSSSSSLSVANDNSDKDGDDNATEPRKKSKSKWVSTLPPCRVCAEPSSGLHYGVNTCDACKVFFRRCQKQKRPLRCKGKYSKNV